jgi:hypothetical protein
VSGDGDPPASPLGTPMRARPPAAGSAAEAAAARERAGGWRRHLTASRLRAVSRRTLWALPFVGANSLFTDVSAISLNVAVGPPLASLLHWCLLAPWCCLVLWALQHHILPDSVAAWLQEREQALSGRTQRLLRWGKPTLVLGLGAVGPLSSLLAIRLFGLKAPRRYALAMGAATVYCVVWTGLIYGGGWLLIQHLLGWSTH